MNLNWIATAYPLKPKRLRYSWDAAKDFFDRADREARRRERQQQKELDDLLRPASPRTILPGFIWRQVPLPDAF